MIVLEIPESTPSLNKTMRGHWSKQYRVRSRWHWLVRMARINAKVFTPPKYAKARVMIERTGPRLLDHDNLAGGAKFLIDGLRHEGLIENDTPAHIQPQFHQIVDRKIRQTIVRIEGV